MQTQLLRTIYIQIARHNAASVNNIQRKSNTASPNPSQHNSEKKQKIHNPRNFNIDDNANQRNPQILPVVNKEHERPDLE